MFLSVDVTSTVQMHFRSFWRAARQSRLAAHERQHAGKQGGSEVLARADHRRAAYTVCAAWLSSCTRQNLVRCITRRFKATSQWRQNQVHIQGGRHWPLPLGMHDVTKEFGFVDRRAGDFATPVFRKRQTENARIILDYAGFFKKMLFAEFYAFLSDYAKADCVKA